MVPITPMTNMLLRMTNHLNARPSPERFGGSSVGFSVSEGFESIKSFNGIGRRSWLNVP